MLDVSVRTGLPANTAPITKIQTKTLVTFIVSLCQSLIVTSERCGLRDLSLSCGYTYVNRIRFYRHTACTSLVPRPSGSAPRPFGKSLNSIGVCNYVYTHQDELRKQFDMALVSIIKFTQAFSKNEYIHTISMFPNLQFKETQL